MKDNNRNRKFKALYDDPGFDELDDYDMDEFDGGVEDGLDYGIDDLGEYDDEAYYDGDGGTGRISHTNKFYDHNYANHDNRDFLIRRLRSLERRVTILWIFLIIMTICALVGVASQYMHKLKGTPLDTSVILSDQRRVFIVNDADELFGEYGTMAAFSEANYVNYLGHAYILIGTYPDCEYVRINPNVTRNTYNWSTDFYVGEGELYYNYYKDGAAQGQIGIDVSEFQLDIDWPKVKAAGVDVAIVRVGYRGYGSGAIKADSKAMQNIDGATTSGLKVGVYFFSSAINREEGIEEAKYTLEAIKGKNITEPIVIDTEYIFEDDSARTNEISIEDRTAAIVGFCETIEAAGYTPMIYASRDHFIWKLDLDQIGKWEFWLAAYDTPVFPYHTEGYQYSPYGYVDGVPTQVDLDVWMR